MRSKKLRRKKLSVKGKKIPKFFIGIGTYLDRFFPALEHELKEANIAIHSREYLGKTAMHCILFFVIASIAVTPIILIYGNAYLLLSFYLFLVFVSLFALIHSAKTAKLKALRRLKSINTNLLNALRHMQIQLSAGINLYRVMVSISEMDYGEVSIEFKKAARRIAVGTDQIEVLEKISIENPSIQFKRYMSLIINNLRAGGNLQNVLKEITSTLSSDQINDVQNYGAKLSPIAMFYLLLVIIIPSLAISFIVALLSFISMKGEITIVMFFLVLAISILLEIMFMGMIESRMPGVMRD